MSRGWSALRKRGGWLRRGEGGGGGAGGRTIGADKWLHFSITQLPSSASPMPFWPINIATHLPQIGQRIAGFRRDTLICSPEILLDIDRIVASETKWTATHG